MFCSKCGGRAPALFFLMAVVAIPGSVLGQQKTRQKKPATQGNAATSNEPWDGVFGMRWGSAVPKDAVLERESRGATLYRLRKSSPTLLGVSGSELKAGYLDGRLVFASITGVSGDEREVLQKLPSRLGMDFSKLGTWFSWVRGVGDATVKLC